MNQLTSLTDHCLRMIIAFLSAIAILECALIFVTIHDRQQTVKVLEGQIDWLLHNRTNDAILWKQ